ncbi:hypothetical protein FQZ97_756210 [compost metagenome]
MARKSSIDKLDPKVRSHIERRLRETAAAFLQSIAGALADMAAQQLAQMASSGLMSLLGGGADSGAGMAAGAAAVTSSAAALSAAGGTLLTGAAAIEVAAASLAAASAGAGAGGEGAGGLLSGIAGALGGGGGASGAGASAGGYSGGGHVLGPGTTTSDSIPANLSNWEYVTRAAVVQQPGALDFLHEFNARGMAALDNWAPRIRHSTGGLAGVPAPALPAPSPGGARLAEPAAAMSTTLKNQVHLYAVQDAAQVASMAWSKPGQDHFMVFLQQNGTTIKQALGIG